MRRILLVLTVAALMAAMMVTAGPAKADISIGGGSSFGDSSFGDSSFGGSSFGGTSFGGTSFNLGDDDDDADGINNSFFVSQVNSEFDDFRPGGISFS